MPRWRGGGPGACRGRGQPRRIRRFIEPAVLLLLHEGPNHGYGLVDGLGTLGLESYPTDISAIYRILYDLEANGMVVSWQETEGTGGPPRRVYRLTEAGDIYLQEWVDELRHTDELLHRFLEAYAAHQQQHARERKTGTNSKS